MGLYRKFETDFEISLLAADRAIVWCYDDKIQRMLVEHRDCMLPAVAHVKFAKWSPKAQFLNTKIECSHGWIGIEGLPLNLWNIHVFKVIGERCGGLIDVDKCTIEKKLLSHAKVQLRGSTKGFIPEFTIFFVGKEDDYEAFCSQW